MKVRPIGAALGGLLAVAGAMASAQAQSVSIPLQYMQLPSGGTDLYRLVINVGINGGAPKQLRAHPRQLPKSW